MNALLGQLLMSLHLPGKLLLPRLLAHHLLGAKLLRLLCLYGRRKSETGTEAEDREVDDFHGALLWLIYVGATTSRPWAGSLKRVPITKKVADAYSVARQRDERGILIRIIYIMEN